MRYFVSLSVTCVLYSSTRRDIPVRMSYMMHHRLPDVVIDPLSSSPESEGDSDYEYDAGIKSSHSNGPRTILGLILA